MRMTPLRVLFVQQEWPTWRQSRHWSYGAHMGIEDGLRANDVECFTTTTPCLGQAREILDGRRFDQVWLNDLVHLDVEDKWLEWVVSLAPVRIGLMVESLNYDPEESTTFPVLKDRRKKVEKRLEYITHLVACDERDAEEANEHQTAPAMWSPFPIPERFIADRTIEAGNHMAVFSGALYGARANWLESPILEKTLVRQCSPENATVYPALFDALHIAYGRFLRRLPRRMGICAYLFCLRAIRRKCFALWLDGMRAGCAVVNLPHFVKTYTTRVVEGMAAGRPVISWEIPNRPKNKALFEDGVEILLYSDPTELAAQIQRILSDPGFAQQLVQNARQKVRRFHTAEKRVQQILHWVESGEVPTYG